METNRIHNHCMLCPGLCLVCMLPDLQTAAQISLQGPRQYHCFTFSTSSGLLETWLIHCGMMHATALPSNLTACAMLCGVQYMRASRHPLSAYLVHPPVPHAALASSYIRQAGLSARLHVCACGHPSRPAFKGC